ncbi:hypothetical protein LCGC14_1412280 [marine sediment metagenome]|uniref:Uncharacterized protein n=1 Tax=marine sediment metagenome TaxID=412755 RepID=A0A0F9JU03_9ZZZZ
MDCPICEISRHINNLKAHIHNNRVFKESMKNPEFRARREAFENKIDRDIMNILLKGI